MSPGEGLGACGLCAAVPSRFSSSLLREGMGMGCPGPHTPEPVVHGGAEAGPRRPLLRSAERYCSPASDC